MEDGRARRSTNQQRGGHESHVGRTGMNAFSAPARARRVSHRVTHVMALPIARTGAKEVRNGLARAEFRPRSAPNRFMSVYATSRRLVLRLSQYYS